MRRKQAWQRDAEAVVFVLVFVLLLGGTEATRGYAQSQDQASVQAAKLPAPVKF